jgi:hypothetical protein
VTDMATSMGKFYAVLLLLMANQYETDNQYEHVTYQLQSSVLSSFAPNFSVLPSCSPSYMLFSCVQHGCPTFVFYQLPLCSIFFCVISCVLRAIFVFYALFLDLLLFVCPIVTLVATCNIAVIYFCLKAV